MSKRYHMTTSDEYMFLKDKTMKILNKAATQPALKAAREKKRARKFIRRLLAIEAQHREMGWPHPEAQFKPNPNLQRALESMKKVPGKEMMANPDGSLYQKDGEGLIQDGSGFTISTKGVMNPDGTPFETPVMEGSIINPNMHSEEKIQEFLESKDDGFLREED